MPRIARLTFGTVEDIWDVQDISEVQDKADHKMHELVDITNLPDVMIGSRLKDDGTFEPPIID